MLLKLGVGKFVPVESRVPSTKAVYHLMSLAFAPGVAVSVTEPGPHLAAPLPVGEEGIGLMVATTAVRVDVLSQPVEVLYELI